MAEKTYQHLYFTNYKDILNWSIQYIGDSGLGFTKKYPMVRIGTFLHRSKKIISIQDNVQYKRVTISTTGSGINVRDTKSGKDIGTKSQYSIRQNQFLLSKIDARNGAFGVVPPEADEAIITSNFWTFDVDDSIILPEFLVLVTRTDNFLRFVEKSSNGTTNRHYLQESLFLQQSIPLPSLEEQEQIVRRYYVTIYKITELENKTTQINRDIEDYILSELGLSGTPTTINNGTVNYIRLFQYSSIKRWDCYNTPEYTHSLLSGCIYPIVEMGDVVNFITRRWKRNELSFRYVEIGAVDSSSGILYANELQTNNAPSRATQIIQKEDLIVGTTRPYLKKFAIVSPEFDNCVCSSGFHVIAPNDNYNLHFLIEFLKTNPAIIQFQYYMTGALYPAITSSDLKKIRIPLPPLKVQNTIADHILEMRKQTKEMKLLSNELKNKAKKEFEKTLFS